MPAAWTFRIGVGIGCITGVRRQELVEFVVVETGSGERIAPAAVWESEPGSGAQIFDVRLIAVVPRGVRGGGPRHDDVGSHAVDTGRRADFGDLEQYYVSELDSSQDRLGMFNPDTKPLFGIRVLSSEGLRVRVEQQPSAHHLGALCRVPRCGHLDGQTEAVEQLRPQLALLGIHRSHQHELR